MDLYEVLRRPIITEKNTMLLAQNKYMFEIAPGANKPQVKQAVEKAFKVKVVAVNMVTIPGEKRRQGRHWIKTSAQKKAIVTLQPGHKIELFAGV